MTTIVTHALVAATIVRTLPAHWRSRSLYLLAMSGSMAPDLDTLGFRFGVAYGSDFGHRGATHSIVFAIALGLLLALWQRQRHGPPLLRWWTILTLTTVTHLLLDAVTDGGLGVAALWPFSSTRFFFPVHPVVVSPIGAHFFSHRGVATLWSELAWVGLPCAIIWLALTLWPRRKYR
ncbi:metal-dependent hydrolase [Silvimonas sp.]|uniref:metal-dependent hydrolase n=1 Tax=Silvimonas sp. TaxID=2650811 RepID=UPI00284797DA|nr:metal-dependent hydrolase [Silvimonas sp.]MDR3428416.1 metal-dependent hydrolase [Silvimonas sp.]